MMKLLKTFSWSDWLILIMSISLFLPHEINCAFLLASVIFIVLKRELVSSLDSMPGKWFLFIFFVLELIVSIVYQNWTGTLIVINFMGLFFYLAFYHKFIRKEVFTFCIDVIIVLMTAIGIYALFQFNEVSKMGGYAFTDFVIQNSPKRRITGVFQNANIFAMMIEVVLTLILYRFLQVKHILQKGVYFIVAIFLFVIMALTGCRAALIPLVFVIPILLFAAKEKRLLILYCICLMGVIGLVIAKPTIIPRIDDISTIESRVKIWKTAIKGFKMYPIFGNGPWTYQRIYPFFHGHKAVHAHNIYLDSLLSFGVVGFTLLAGFVIECIRSIRKVKSNDRLLYGCMISLLVIIGLHGLVDGTIHPAKVMMLTFMIWFCQSDLKTENVSDTV